MQNPPRDFKGIWISKEIWLHPELSIEEKVLLAEIHSLDGEDGCFASNEYFMKFFGWKKRNLQDRLSRLKKLGFIQQESFDGRTRILRSYAKTTYEKFSTSQVQNPAPPRCKILHPSLIGKPIERENKEENKDKIPPPPSSSSPAKEEQPTKEEEEELSIRLKERPKEYPPVKCLDKWKRAALEKIRKDSVAKKVDSLRIVKRRSAAMKFDALPWPKDKDFKVWALADHVEFVYGSQIITVRYDVSDEEWEKKTGWK
jgi:hypothetical protein